MTEREYRNPVLAADWSDPDAIRVGGDFYLVASSFHRVPGLPILHSRDLVHWTIIGHALDRLEPAAEFAVPRHGRGVWAPSIRYHAGRFWIFYPDPDRGIFVTTAAAITGPWSRPHAIKSGRGLIDPCPLWDGDGTAYLVHAWARSRAGFNNRITCHRMSTDASVLLDRGRTIIDGDRIPGCRTLEGPKIYRRGDRYWIFAPAGGVATGWQYAFRSRQVLGPYEHRVVLAQGGTDVNGPHQGAWVDTAAGQDWFLHFQDRGAYGRVVHLQPMRWDGEDWPGIGVGPGAPVYQHPVPAVGARPSEAGGAPFEAGGARPSEAGPSPAAGGIGTRDDFPAGQPGPQWSWQANPRPSWLERGGPGGLRLACVRSPAVADLRRLPNVLCQRLPAAPATISATVTLASQAPGARAGLGILGRAYAWIGLERTPAGIALVCRTADAPAASRPAASVGGFGSGDATGGPERDLTSPTLLPAGCTTATLLVRVGDGAVCRFGAAEAAAAGTPAAEAAGAAPAEAPGAPAAEAAGTAPAEKPAEAAGVAPAEAAGVAPPRWLSVAFPAQPGHWVGATPCVFAAAPPGDGVAGHAEFAHVTVAGD